MIKNGYDQMMNAKFFLDEKEAITHAKEIDGVVIWSKGPEDKTDIWGYWVESKPDPFIRSWERQIYP